MDNKNQPTSEVGDEDVVTGPTIQGLDSLLSAPIKDQTEQNSLPASMVLQEDRVDFQPKELTMTMDFTQTHGAILTDIENHHTMQRSRISSSETESDASIQHDIDVPNPTFVGPSYSCLMPVSFSSSTATEPGDSVSVAAEMDQTRVFQSDDTTGFMDLTNCYGGLMNSSTSERKSQKTDTNSFLQSLIKPTQHRSNTSEFLRSLMTPKCNNDNLQTGCLPQTDTGITSYTKDSSFPETKSCVDVNQLVQYRPDMEVVIQSTGIDKENQDHSILLAANRSGSLQLTGNKTRVFSNDQADMDMTECVPSNALSISQVENKNCRTSHILTEDQTRMFTTEDAEKMEMTDGVGNVLQASFSQDLKDKKIADQTVMLSESQDHSILLAAKRSGALELADNKTRIYSNDDQGDMDMTECVPSNALSISRVGTEESQRRTSHILPEDRTRLFTTEDAGLMEMTECIGNVLQASFSQDLKDKKVADQTVMFADGGDADMDETTPLGQIQLSSSSSVAGHEDYKPSFRNKSLSIIQEVDDENVSRRNSSVINCTSTNDHKYIDRTTHGAFVNDFTIGMDFTANVGQIIRPKYTSTPFQQTLSKSLCAKDNVLGQEITSSQGEMNQESKSGKESKGQTLEMPKYMEEETVKMELTSCVGGPMPENLKRTSGGFENHCSASEITRIFGLGEHTNRMELTSCVGGLLQQSSKIGQHNITVAEMTSAVSIGEDTGKMELTSCVGRLVPTNQVKTPVSVRNVIPAVETTQVFGMGEETGRMELTSCVGGLLPTNPRKTPMNVRNIIPSVEMTQVTGRMELTSCVSGLLQSNQPKTPKSDRKEPPAADTTTMPEDTRKMEMTSCVGEPVSTHQTLLKDRSKTSVAETTHLFGMTEDTERMEFASCVGSLHMSNTSNEAAAETTVFGIRENTGRMELTSCVGGFVQTNKVKPSNNIKIPAAEMTRVFGTGDDTGMMELTSCIGGLQDATATFRMEENTGKMDITSYIGGLPQTSQAKTPISRKTPAAEKTRVYGIGDYTGRMELTSCIGGLLPTSFVDQHQKTAQEKMPESNRCKIPAAETTKLFSIGEDTGRMELTSCVEGVLQQCNESSQADIERKYCIPEDTGIIGLQKESDKMDLTCIDNHLQQCEVVESDGEEPVAKIHNTESEMIGSISDINIFLTSKKSDITNSHAQIPDMINQSNISQIADLGTRILETETMNMNSVKALQQLSSSIASQSTSVPVTENMAESEHSEVSSIGIDILGTDDKDRSAGTFTILKSGDADTFTIAGESESCRQAECPEEVFPRAKRKQEVDCLEESRPHSKLLKTDLHDTFVTREKEESTKGILEELPPDEIEELENLDLTAATTFHVNEASNCKPSVSSDEDGSQKESLSKSILDRTVMDNLSFLDTAKSAGNEITVGEFLEKFLSANLTSLPPATNDRRSLMPVLQRSEPNDLASCLRSSCIDTPKCQMYEWAVEYVSQNIETMERSVSELTEKLYHKEEMKKKMIIGSTEMKGFEKRVQKLHQVCRKGTKTSWKEWKSKMLSSILTSVTERHDHLKKTVESISEFVTQIDSDIQELEKYETDLDTAINELESLDLPDEEQQQLYIEQQGKISLLERELEGMQENQTTLQKEYELLVKEEEWVQSELQDLEEKRNKVEEVDNVAENLQTAYNKCKRIERLCEGKVKEWDDSSCAVAFLYDSLWLRVTYGGAVLNDLKERVVSSVQFESYLENTSAPSAHLSHIMMQEAVDCKTLLQKYPTTNCLPKMLEELSYIACHARSLECDIRHVQFWHPVEIHNTKVEVEFSNFRAFAKFYITFELVPDSYPAAPVKFTFTNKIGKVSEDDINTVVTGVRPGYCYFKRLVEAVDTYIKECSINTDHSEES
ncbi:uncharacterized protein LOC117108460 isoform X2 [Anneissia japonica]|uniref:uncharacterized protein LOC117108460 isoform X2 n=1 Tax=Anneissia japonica TaxID=1529436 RepID=UPI001425B454|nr:uncharacterized protein LOC117108460 isoform X2 [Anneissia japonica]